MNYRKSYICKLLLTTVLMVTAATAQGASDAYSVPDVAIKAGEQASFKISLTNQSKYTSATIDLQLPKGISIPKVLNEDGEWVYAAECPAKKSDHNLTVSLINAATNTYRFLVYSASNKTFRSGSVLFTVTVEADKDMVDGVYKAKLIASDRYDPLVEPDGTQSFLEDVEFRISVTSTIYKLSIQTLGKGSVRYGDATVRDYSQFTIQKGNDVELVFVPDNGYELSQATVNGKDIKGKVVDGRYAIQNVNEDIVVMASFMEVEINHDVYSVPDIAIKAGEQASFEISLTNQSTYTCATIDLQLPKGISIPKVPLAEGRSSRSATPETTIWSGSFALGNWAQGLQELAWGGYDWSQVTAGTTLKLYYEVDPSVGYINIRFGNGSWAALPSTQGWGPDGNASPDPSETSIKTVLTDADIDQLLNAGGLVICGAGIICKKITLNEDVELDFAVDCPAKKSDHNLTVSLINAATNTYRFLVYSASNKTFKSGSALFKVTVEADKDMADGVYKAKLIASSKYDPLVKPDGTQSFLEDVDFNISVTSISYKLSIQTSGKGSVHYGDATVRNYSQFNVTRGNDVELVFVPDNGYKLSQATVNGKDIMGKVVDSRYTIQNVNEDIVVTANFTEAGGTFTVEGINYRIISAPNKTVSVAKGSYKGHLTIPEKVTHDEQTWSVVGIDDNTFNNCTQLISVNLPATIQSANVGISLFTGCTNLAAIVWNPRFALSSTALGAVDNPNLLFYAANKNYTPASITNIVVNGTATSIRLQDVTSDNGNFYCPISFTANSISYTHNYNMQSAIGGVQGWETIALPFTVQKIEHFREGEIVPFAKYDNHNGRPFWLCSYGSNGFTKATTIEANKPYIICMPNNEEYDAEYRLDGDVTFSAKNAQVESSDNVSKSQHGNRYFVPAFILQQKSRQKYALNVINVLHSETGSYEPGSTFVANLRNISPFEAYMTDNAAGARMDIPIELNEATSIDGLEIAEGADGIQRVFNMAGQLLIRTDNVPELKRQIELLPAGVYIVNGKKKQIK